jgi:hypothetical protein
MTETLRFLMPAFILALGLSASCDRQDTEDSTTDQATQQTKAKRQRQPQSKPAKAAGPLSPAELNEVLQEATSLIDPAERDKALEKLAWRSLEIDSAITARAFEQMSPGSPEREPLIDYYLNHLMEQQGVDQAIAWAGSLSTPEEIASARLKLALMLAATEPERSMNLLPRPKPNDPPLEGAGLHVLQRWSSESPASAATWATKLPAGPYRESSIKAVLTGWTQLDAPAAFDWYSKLTHPTLRQEATQAIVQSFSEQPEFIRQSWLDQMPAPLRESLESQHQRLLDLEAAQNPPDLPPTN